MTAGARQSDKSKNLFRTEPRGVTDPDQVLHFWFAGKALDATMAKYERRWFGTDPEFDAAIHARFATDIRAAAAGELDAWACTPAGRLPLIILMDQFSRNAFRNTAEAYASDPSAVTLALDGVARGMDRLLSPIERIFFYLPLLHSERLTDQDCGVVCFRRLCAETAGATAQWLRLSHRHRRMIARFGRFPHRNAILGRETNSRERAVLLYQKLRSHCGRLMRGLPGFK